MCSFLPFDGANAVRAKSKDTSFGEPSQMDLFPMVPVVDVLEPQSIVGAKTAVEHVVRVRARANDVAHLVFHDRHGWYCETHGPTCAAVALARSAVNA